MPENTFCTKCSIVRGRCSKNMHATYSLRGAPLGESVMETYLMVLAKLQLTRLTEYCLVIKKGICFRDTVNQSFYPLIKHRFCLILNMQLHFYHQSLWMMSLNQKEFSIGKKWIRWWRTSVMGEQVQRLVIHSVVEGLKRRYDHSICYTLMWF